MRPVEAIFAALHERGHSPLPISRRLRSDDPKAFGKAPGVYGGIDPETKEARWFLLKKWQAFCVERATVHRARAWGRMADSSGGGLGIACGYDGLIGIDVDNEALIEPLKAVLPPIIVAKRGRKGLTAFYRGEHPCSDTKWWQKKNYTGLLDFLAAGSQTVLPPSIHPDTSKPYEWITARTLLDTSVGELPAFTNEHRVAMEEILREHGWMAPKAAQPRQSAAEQPSRAPSAKVTHSAFLSAVKAARAQWVPFLGLHGLQRESNCWRSVASFRPSGSGQPLSKRGLNLTIYDHGPIKDFRTNKGYNDITLAAVCLFGDITPDTKAKARAWLAEAIGWSETPAIFACSPIEPTYRDQRYTLDDAVSATVSHVERFFGDVVPEVEAENFKYERSIELWRLGLGKHPLWAPRAQVVALSPETGLGKSTAIEKPVVEQKRNLGRNIVMAFQTIKLAEERAGAYRAMDGLKVQVYRGYEADDPDAPGSTMCRNIEAYRAAKDTVSNIYAAICEQKASDGTVKHCPYFKECGKQKQRKVEPDMWFVTSALLMSQRPEFISEPDTLVIDEALHSYCFADHESAKTNDWLTAPLDGVPDEEKAFVRQCRAALHGAIRDNGIGPLSSKVLHSNGITAASAHRAAELEERRLYSHFIQPDMNETQRKVAMERHGAARDATRQRVAVWREIAEFLSEGDTGLYGDRTRSGRIVVERGNVTVKPFRPVHWSWRVPTLYLDATAPPAAVLEIVFGEQTANKPVVDVLANVTARWSEHVTVRQIVGAPIAMGRLGLVETPNPNNVTEVVRYVETRAKQTFPAEIGFITYKGLLEQIVDRLPSNVVTAHFGAVAGLNSMKDLAGLIVLGRPQVKPNAVEESASILAGYPIDPIGDYYKKKDGGIRLADGSHHRVDVEFHPDPFAEAFRWLVTEANLLQAIGRLRPHRRKDSAWLEIVCDVALPITVDQVIEWQRLNGADVMVAGGLILTNRRDAAQIFDNLSEEEARGWVDALLRSQSRTATQPLQRNIRYRKAGPGTKVNEAIHLPGVSSDGPDDIRAKLESKLGSLALFEPDRVKLKDSLWAQNTLAQSFRAHIVRFSENLKMANSIVEADENSASDKPEPD